MLELAVDVLLGTFKRHPVLVSMTVLAIFALTLAGFLVVMNDLAA